ncbi:hypothetical protein PITCH_A1960006 [uncultured Desulfobacterium sp.]|uniref:Uncharacterized protein n=1 Tax=uncultured Desulfobacterium sp. TaxID=201089 RepID=A0A445MW95_9BACT|nr:hypothetical protein PITCH_A1960006 [uncultured Desulfobacterium sp.]
MFLKSRIANLERRINPPKRSVHIIRFHECEDPDQIFKEYNNTHEVQDGDIVVKVQFFSSKNSSC